MKDPVARTASPYPYPSVKGPKSKLQQNSAIDLRKMISNTVNKTALHPHGVAPQIEHTELEEELHETAHIDYDRVAIIPNPSVAALYEDALVYETGTAITSSGALTAYSGAKTGRSPLDKRIVKEPSSEDNVWWGPVNKPMSPEVGFGCFFSRPFLLLLSYPCFHFTASPNPNVGPCPRTSNNRGHAGDVRFGSDGSCQAGLCRIGSRNWGSRQPSSHAKAAFTSLVKCQRSPGRGNKVAGRNLQVWQWGWMTRPRYWICHEPPLHLRSPLNCHAAHSLVDRCACRFPPNFT
jgi:hypothetical protein